MFFGFRKPKGIGYGRRTLKKCTPIGISIQFHSARRERVPPFSKDSLPGCRRLAKEWEISLFEWNWQPEPEAQSNLTQFNLHSAT